VSLWDTLSHAWLPLILIIIIVIAAYALGIVMSVFNLVGAVLSYATQTKINYGWANANYVYTFFEVLIGAVAMYGIVRLLAALRAER
jgi:uncharacterized membrane protein